MYAVLLISILHTQSLCCLCSPTFFSHLSSLFSMQCCQCNIMKTPSFFQKGKKWELRTCSEITMVHHSNSIARGEFMKRSHFLQWERGGGRGDNSHKREAGNVHSEICFSFLNSAEKFNQLWQREIMFRLGALTAIFYWNIYNFNYCYYHISTTVL